MSSSPLPRIPRLRWSIGLLLGVGTLINYFDRLTLSVAGPDLQRELHIGPAEMGWLFSAFFWTYAVLQIPVGVILDRFGVTVIGRWSAFLWGLASTATACASGFGGIFAARAILGISEAPCFPANAKATGHWFPRHERGLATAIFDSAAKFSNVIGLPVIAYAILKGGWRWGFGVTAILSFGYFAAFYLFYHNPSEHPKITPAEALYIREGGGVPEGGAPTDLTGMLGYLLGKMKVWGLVVGFSAYGYVVYLFLTWLPGYLVQTMHLNLLTSAGYAAIPWGFATLTDLAVGGWLIDHLVRKGWNETRVRKSVLVTGMFFGLAVFGATQTTSANWAIFWISISLGGLAAAAPVCWSMPSLIAPKGGVATIAGIMNFSNNIGGGIAPLATGYIVAKTQSFTNAFLLADVILIIGIISIIFVMGKIEPIPDRVA
jgi:ACS family D-galactonate transporter-like MFS transporter